MSLAFIPTSDGFDLRQSNADGSEKTMHLTMEDAANLLAQVEHLRQSLQSRFSRSSAAAVLASEVQKIELGIEALEDKLLILMTLLDGRTVNYAVQRPVALQFSLTLRRELENVPTAPGHARH
jgi:hypothetical protein